MSLLSNQLYKLTSWQQPRLNALQWDLKQVTKVQNPLIWTRSDSLTLWLTLWKAPAVQVPGGKTEALWNDAATAGALGQRQMSLRGESGFSAAVNCTTFTQAQEQTLVLSECFAKWVLEDRQKAIKLFGRVGAQGLAVIGGK